MQTQGVPAEQRDQRSTDGAVDVRRLFLAHLEVIETITRKVAGRWRFLGEQAEDFDGQVKLHLIQNDYLVLRRFRGGSQLTTYLTRVINNLARDFRAQQVGRFRPSRSAQRMGVDAIELERLIYHEGWGHEEALEILRRSGSPRGSQASLEALVGRLPARTSKRPVPLEALLPSEPSGTTADPLGEIQLSELREQVRHCLFRVEADLSLADRLLLHLRFTEGLTVAEIARRKKMDQRELYGRFAKILASFRCCFERSDLSWSAISALLGREPSTESAIANRGHTSREPYPFGASVPSTSSSS